MLMITITKIYAVKGEKKYLNSQNSGLIQY